MRTFDLICYLLAAVCFALAAIGTPERQVRLIPLGLLAWVLVPLATVIHAS